MSGMAADRESIGRRRFLKGVLAAAVALPAVQVVDIATAAAWDDSGSKSSKSSKSKS